MLHLLQTHVDESCVPGNAPGGPSYLAPQLFGVSRPRTVLSVGRDLGAALAGQLTRLVLHHKALFHDLVPFLAIVFFDLVEVFLHLLQLPLQLVPGGLGLVGLGHRADQLLPPRENIVLELPVDHVEDYPLFAKGVDALPHALVLSNGCVVLLELRAEPVLEGPDLLRQARIVCTVRKGCLPALLLGAFCLSRR